ncbi:MAG: ribonuclease P protein component [Muribaculaceae bacterium]|nr:ribonuclease P protein component [Muribaculaceae bacterium]
MKKYSLGKRHKLCSLTAIDILFADRSAEAALAYPLRAVWRVSNRRDPNDSGPKFLISIPKKRLRRAVDRVTMRRRVREAYRLNHSEFDAANVASQANVADENSVGNMLTPNARTLDIAFIYVADKLMPSRAVTGAMRKLLKTIYSPQRPDFESPNAQ